MPRWRVLLLVLLLAGCAQEQRPVVVQGESRAESGAPCVAATPVAEPLPPGFPEPPAGAQLTDVEPEQVTGRVVGEVEDALAHFRSSIAAGGYVVLREEDEGRSAQVSFFGARAEGSLIIAALTCPAGSTGFTLRVRRTA